jgi:taurine---2-oxoglutarate transaminase
MANLAGAGRAIPTGGGSNRFLAPWQIQGTQRPPVIVRARGSYLYDGSGTAYFDLSSGWICTNLGYSNPRIASAIAARASTLSYVAPHLGCDVRTEFAQRLCEYAPWAESARVHFTSGGGDANDDAIRIARRLTGRSKVLAAYRSYHGDTLASAALTGGARRWAAEPMIPPGVVRFFTPGGTTPAFDSQNSREETNRALRHLDSVIGLENPDSIAALIIEPVLGSAGLIDYPTDYLRGLRELATKYGILLIHDEVMCGFGRVGEIFASARARVEPDIVTFAKGVTGAHVPLGGFLIRESLANAFDQRVFDCGHTYSGHPVAMAAGIAALDEYEHGEHFSSAYRIENWLTSGLADLKKNIDTIGDIRGIGAFIGLDLVRDRATMEPTSTSEASSAAADGFIADLMRSGVWLYHRNGLCIFAPPLNCTEAEIHGALEIFGTTLRRHQAAIAIS